MTTGCTTVAPGWKNSRTVFVCWVPCFSLWGSEVSLEVTHCFAALNLIGSSFGRMRLPIRRWACLRPDYLPSTQKESSSRREPKATSPRTFAWKAAWKRRRKSVEMSFSVTQWCVLCFVGTVTSVSWWNISSQCCQLKTALPPLWHVPSTAASPTGRSRFPTWTWTRCCRSQNPDPPLPVCWDCIAGPYFILRCLVAEKNRGAHNTQAVCLACVLGMVWSYWM